MTIPVILPRFIRLRDAPAYLGMDRHRFNSEVRPQLIEIPIGDQGISFVVPYGSLVVFVIAAIAAGLLAAIAPARRASRLNVLRALHYE